MSMKPNEKHSIEDVLSEDKIIDILKNVQSGPITYSKVKLILDIHIHNYYNKLFSPSISLLLRAINY